MQTVIRTYPTPVRYNTYEDYTDRVVVLYNAEEKEFMCYKKLIVAWQQLPEPYKGEEAAG